MGKHSSQKWFTYRTQIDLLLLVDKGRVEGLVDGVPCLAVDWIGDVVHVELERMGWERGK